MEATGSKEVPKSRIEENRNVGHNQIENRKEDDDGRGPPVSTGKSCESFKSSRKIPIGDAATSRSKTELANVFKCFT